MSSLFILDNRLKNDTEMIFETDLLLYLLMNDSRYPWVILVPKVPDVTELHELNERTYNELMSASKQLGADMMLLFNGHKLNVGAIGNQVRQLHLHHVVRQQTDFAWPNPVWGHGESTHYCASDRESLLQKMRQGLCHST